MKRSALFLPLFATATVGCTVSVQAPPPKPNYVAEPQLPGKVTGEVTGATDKETCSETPGVKKFCVTGLKTAMTTGFEKIVGDFSGAGSAGFKATLEVVDFTLAPAAVDAYGNVAAVNMQMRWKLTVRTGDGQVVGAVADTTIGPKAVGSTGGAEDAFGALEAAVLEKASDALKQAGQKAAHPDAAATANPS